ncbi:MAG: T9SS type A sorting domain-containing protein [Bacteroidota bacterium]
MTIDNEIRGFGDRSWHSYWVFLVLYWNIFPLPAQWIQTLPPHIQSEIIWSADHEEGSLADWTYPDFQYAGGGIFNTGGSEVEVLAGGMLTHSGMYAAKATITQAFQAQNGSRAIRLMRWTDRPWDDGGDFIPSGMYYSCWYYLPHSYNPNKYDPWDPGDGGWWNIFQFKSHDAQDVSQPIWTLNVWHDDATEDMYLYLYSKENPPHSYDPVSWTILPSQQWVHLEAWYQFNDSAQQNGALKFWQDGMLLFDIDSITTVLEGGYAVWGIGNYTDHIVGDTSDGTATIWMDDAVISAVPIHPHLMTTASEDLAEKRDPISYIGITNKQLYIQLTEPGLGRPLTLNLYSLQGQALLETPLAASDTQVDLSHLTSGLYICTIHDPAGSVSFYKLQLQ